jgi:glycosyltransferase involved in cell wall biosynthesis
MNTEEPRVAFTDSRHKWGGVSTKILVLAKEFSRRGIPVYLFVRKNGTNIRRYQKYLDNVIPVSFGPDYNPAALLKFYYYFKKLRITHVITNVQKEITTAAVAAKKLNLVNIRFLGGLVDLRGRPKEKKFIEKYADLIHVNSRFLMDELKKRYDFFPAGKIRVVWNGTDFYHFTPAHQLEMRKKTGLLPSHIVIGYIGQFSPLKRIEIAVEKMSRLFNEHEKLRMVLAGSGETLEKSREVAVRLGLGNKIVFFGYLENISEVLPVMDIGILPSSDEGLPNSLLEYLSAGIPQVASEVGGVPEAVIHKETGFLFSPDNWDEMLEKLQLLIENENLRRRMADASKRRFLEHFSGKVFADKFIKEFLK